nr:hypothetical protein [uncultured Lachnoanaerobaculum sp.]
MCFSLFIIAMAVLIMPFDMMNTNRKIRGIAEAVCKDSCQYAYTYYRFTGNAREEENENYDHEAMENVKGVFAGGAIGSFVVAKINTEVKDKNISNIHGLLSTCMSDGETICIRIDYKYSLPIGIFKNTINQTVVASRRAWIGADGGKGFGSSDDEEYVYIGRNSTRYHLDPRCHYLYNDLRCVSLSEIAGIRNDNGARYQPCERCGNRAGTSVYIMPSGTRYHSDPDCSAIIAYVQRVKLSDVEHLGVCSYCGGRH